MRGCTPQHSTMIAFAFIATAALLIAPLMITDVSAEDTSSGTADGFDPELVFDAVVLPFSLPEDQGLQILDALSKAEKSIRIEADILRDKNILRILSEKTRQGLDVDILLNGGHLSEESTTSKYWTEEGYSTFKSFVRNGADVRYINPPDSEAGSRISDLAQGFIVVDDDTVVLASNGFSASFSSGDTLAWGAVIRSEGYAEYMTRVFEDDRSYEHGDVMHFIDVFLEVPAVTGGVTTVYPMPEWDPDSFASYSAKVVPVMSPEGRWEAIQHYSEEAATRLYAEQMSISEEYRILSTGPLSLMRDAASRGVDTEILLSRSAGTYETLHMINTGSSVRSAMIMGTVFYNTGIVADDTVLFSTGPWTSASFDKARWPCVAIISGEVADFCASAFKDGFDPNAGYEGFTVTIQGMKETYAYGEKPELTAHVNPAGSYTYRWEVLGDDSQTPTGRTASFDLPWTGRNIIAVTVTDGTGHTFYDRVNVYMDEEDPDYTVPLILLGAVIAVIVAAVGWKLISRRRHSKAQ